MAFPAVRVQGLPARTFRILLSAVFKRRRLAKSGAPRVVQLSFEMLDLLSETLVFQAQSLALVGGIRWTMHVVRLGRFRHAAVMPEFLAKYKTRRSITIDVAIASAWRLSHATRAQRANWQLIGKGKRIYWPDIDEDLSLENLLEGIPVQRLRRASDAAQRPANQALQPTSRIRRTGKSRRRSRTARG